MDRPRNARIAGIVIYAVLALILLPLLFSEPVDPRTTIRSRFAQAERPPVIVDPTPTRGFAPTASPQLPARARKELPVGNPAKPAPAPTRTPSQASVQRKPQPTQRAAVPTTRPTARKNVAKQKTMQPGWRLQLASYTDQGSAERFVKRLREDGLEPRVIGAQSGSRRVWRVSVEFHASRAEANALKRKLDKRYRVNGLLQQSK